jgi:hypothetical protein
MLMHTRIFDLFAIASVPRCWCRCRPTASRGNVARASPARPFVVSPAKTRCVGSISISSADPHSSPQRSSTLPKTPHGRLAHHEAGTGSRPSRRRKLTRQLWPSGCKFRSFRQAISAESGRRFRLKPTGRFGPKRHPISGGVGGTGFSEPPLWGRCYLAPVTESKYFR